MPDRKLQNADASDVHADRSHQPSRMGRAKLTARERGKLIRELAEIQVELQQLSERAALIAERSGVSGPLV